MLEVDGIDTFSSVEINGNTVIETNDAFIPYAADITGLVSPGSPVNISVTIHSTPLRAQQRTKNYPYPVPGAQFSENFPSMNHVRTWPANGGWDWGIAAGATGIWRGMRVVEVPSGSARIARASVFVRPADDPAEPGSARHRDASNVPPVAPVEAEPIPGNGFVVRCRIMLRRASDCTAVSGTLRAAVAGVPGAENSTRVSLPTLSHCPLLPALDSESELGSEATLGIGSASGFIESAATVNVSIPLSDVELWWTRDLGGQPLYNVSVEFVPDSSSHLDPPLVESGDPESKSCSGASVGSASSLRAGSGNDGGNLRSLGGYKAGNCESMKSDSESNSDSDSRAVDSIVRRVGFSYTEVVQEPPPEGTGAGGLTFRFRINGVPIFARGASIVP